MTRTKRGKKTKFTAKGDKKETKEKKMPTRKSKSALYQLYKPQLKDDITVKLRIGGSENIDRSNLTYSVGVFFPYSIERFDETTSKSASKQSPQWNEDLTFHIDKLHLQDSDITCAKLVLKLTEHESIIFYPNSEYSEECYLRDILINKKVIFKTSSREIMVYITKVEFDHQPDVRVRDPLHLCEDEEIFFKERRKFLDKELKKQNEQESSTSILHGLKQVPNIAVIGSGGGMRAVVGMCGAMLALKELGILDAAMYTAGVSGSAWYLSTLYADEPGFDTVKVNNSIRESLNKAYATFEELLPICIGKFYLPEFYGNNRSVTDIFGTEVGGILLQKNHKEKWSDLRGMLQKAEFPLPLLAAVHVRDSKTTIRKFHEWIECSPYEVFMPKYGTSIDMKHFGSEFDGGFVTKRKEEQSIHFLQGVCGSAYADALNYHRKVKDKDSEVTSLEKNLENIAINFLEKRFLGTVPNWLHGIPTFKRLFPEKNEVLDTWKEIIDIKKQEMTLADAGTVFNSPYPLVLHPARDIDVIISFDFSEYTDGSKDSFGELIKAEAWALSRGIQFPNVKKSIENTKFDKDKVVHEFQDGNSPCILHFTMNVKNKTSPQESQTATATQHTDTKELTAADIGTKKLRYSYQEFDGLSELMKTSVMDSKKCIAACIGKVIQKRHKPNTENES